MTLIYGHRGAHGEAPENTIAGFQHARAAGAAGIETDIALTADFCPVLHHDPALPSGRLIRNLAFAELSGVPALATALKALPEMDWLLEVKTYPADPAATHSPQLMVRALRAAVIHAGINPARLQILAFDWAVLAQLSTQTPELRRICLTAPSQESERYLWWGSGYGVLSTPQAVARSGAHGWAPQYKTLTTEQIAEARSLGLTIIPWTVNEPDAIRLLAPLVDGIITDFPTLASKTLKDCDD